MQRQQSEVGAITEELSRIADVLGELVEAVHQLTQAQPVSVNPSGVAIDAAEALELLPEVQ